MDARVQHEINDSHIYLLSWWVGLPKLAGFKLGKYLRKEKRLQVKINVTYVMGSSELQKIGNGQIANKFGIQDGYIFTLTSLGLRLDRRSHFSGVNLGPLGGRKTGGNCVVFLSSLSARTAAPEFTNKREKVTSNRNGRPHNSPYQLRWFGSKTLYLFSSGKCTSGWWSIKSHGNPEDPAKR